MRRSPLPPTLLALHWSASTSLAVSTAPRLGAALRADFPLLHQEVWEGKQLVYLDSAATSQKPTCVLDAMQQHQQNDNANVHRGAHLLSVRSTDSYEGARDKVAGFINAASRSEVIFTRGATEAINLVAQTWGRANLGEGDEIVLTVMEHHSNLVPWQMLAEERGFTIKFAPLDAGESLDLKEDVAGATFMAAGGSALAYEKLLQSLCPLVRPLLRSLKPRIFIFHCRPAVQNISYLFYCCCCSC